MNIDYKILWIEDNDNWYKIHSKLVERMLSAYHYRTNIDRYKKSVARVKGKLQNYDLILVDYQLSEKTTGDMIITQIRDVNKYSDIIFYSSNPNFESTIKSMDGIFYSARKRTELMVVVKNLIEKTIKKSYSCSSIRGLFVDVTSTFDNTFSNIIGKLYHEAGGYNQELNQIALDCIEKSMQYNENKFVEMQEGVIDLNTYEGFVKAHLPARTVVKILDKYISKDESLKLMVGSVELFFDKNKNKINLQSKYIAEIINFRNAFAHSKKVINGQSEEAIFINEKEVMITEKFINEQRKKLINFDNSISELARLIDSN